MFARFSGFDEFVYLRHTQKMGTNLGKCHTNQAAYWCAEADCCVAVKARKVESSWFIWTVASGETTAPLIKQRGNAREWKEAVPKQTKTHPHAEAKRGGGEGVQLPGRRITMEAPSDCGGAKKSQHCHNYFLKHSTFASERPQLLTWGAKLASCPGRHLTSLRPCPRDQR